MASETELAVKKFLEQQPHVTAPAQPKQAFQEDQSMFEMPRMGGFLSTRGNVLVIALGVIFAGSISGLITRFLPSTGQYATILAGLLLMYIGRNKAMIKDFGAGVLISGLAGFFGGYFSGMLGGGTPTAEPMMEETRVTYGGTNGVYPEQPMRRVFR